MNTHILKRGGQDETINQLHVTAVLHRENDHGIYWIGGWVVRYLSSPTGIKPRSHGCPAHNLIATLTEGPTSVHICRAYTGHTEFSLFPIRCRFFFYYLRLKHTITVNLRGCTVR
jgi:hypothetical protein